MFIAENAVNSIHVTIHAAGWPGAQRRPKMTEPTDFKEFCNKAAANSSVSGFGMNTTQHMPCPGCAEPDWKLIKIAQAEKDMTQESTCKHCGRSFKVIVDHPAAGATNFEFVQTGGPDVADWMQPKIRRI